MPVEQLDNVIAVGDDVFSQTTAPGGNVSVWCVYEGAAADGFKSEDQVMQQGLPFGHGSRSTVRGFKRAMVKKADGKGERSNIVTGPMGRKYIELYVDEASMVEKQKWEGSVSNERVKDAQGASPVKGLEDDNEIKSKVTLAKDRVERLSDDEIDAIAERQLKTVLSESP